MVHAELASLALTLAAGNADVLEKMVVSHAVDATVLVTGVPVTESGESNRTHFRKIEWRNINTLTGDDADLDDVVFRISTADYTTLVNNINLLFTPDWSQTDSQLEDNQNNAIIRALIPPGNPSNTNAVQMTINTPTNGQPGNVNNAVFGSLADLHIGYVAAAMTNAHEGRAILLNETDIFDTVAGASASVTSAMGDGDETADSLSFGNAVMRGLFPTNDTATESGYYTEQMTQDKHGPLKELLSALYHDAPERFQQSTANDTEQFDMDGTPQPLPLEKGDIMSFKLTVSSNLRMGTNFLAIGTTVATAQGILQSVLPASSIANPSTYAKPFNVDDTVVDAAASDTAVANSEAEGDYSAGIYVDPQNNNQITTGSKITCGVRPQKYLLKITLEDE